MPELDVFLSWSGTLSHDVARELYDWLPVVLPGIKPWISSEDIAKGKSWFAAISAQLGKSPVCIACITAKNARAPWLYYEAGAIAFSMDDPSICAYLIDTGTDAIGNTPLGQEQATRYDREDTFRLIKSINRQLPNPHDESLLRTTFDKKWPALKKKIDKLLADQQKDTSPPTPPPPPAAPPLSALAIQILIQAVSGDRHTVTMSDSMHGFNLGAGSKVFASDLMDDRSEAELRAAVDELEARGLIADKDHKREVFGITQKGYGVADEQRKRQPTTNAELSQEAKHVVSAAAEGDGHVMMLVTSAGFHLQANHQQLCAADDPRVEAAYRAALKELERRGLLDKVGHKGEIFQLTDAGYKLADELKAINDGNRITPAATEDDDILVLLQGWVDTTFSGQRTKPLQYAEVDRELKLPSGASARLLPKAAAKRNWIPETSGPNYVVFKNTKYW